MDTVIERRKGFIINFIYACIFIGIYYCAVKFALAYVFPFLFASAIAVTLQRPVNAIKRKLHIKSHSAVAVLLVVLITGLVVGVLYGIAAIIFDELKEFLSFLFSQFSSVDTFLADIEKRLVDLVSKLPASLSATVAGYIKDFFANLSSNTSGAAESGGFDLSMLSAPISGAWNVVKGIPSVVVSALVTVISCVFVTADYENIKELVFGMLSKERGEKLRSSKRTVTRGVGKLFKAYATIMLITFSEMFLGLYLMKLIGVYKGGYIAIIAFVTCVVDIIPVLGTGTVLIPWAVISMVLGNFGLGIALLVLYAVITVLRQIIEPKLVANQVGLPAIVTIMAMFLGSRLFGVLGIIILPLTVIVVKLMFDEGVIGNKKSDDEKVEAESVGEVEESENEAAKAENVAVTDGEAVKSDD